MKKTISISLASTPFTIEEDGYATLRAYLDSIDRQFSQFESKDEIVNDIEARIAEKFSLHNKGVISKADVDAVIQDMGSAEDLGQIDAGAPRQNPERRLYRNPDDAIIAGVSSGIAAYLGIDATVVRLIFLITVFFGGTGIIVYIILWLVMPEARTAPQKLEMRGNPVTIDEMKSMLHERTNEIKKRASKGSFKHIVSLPIEALKRIFGFIGKYIGPFILAAVAVFFVVVGFVAFLAITTGFATALFIDPTPYTDIPPQSILGGSTYFIGIGSLYITFGIPALFLLISGISILRKKSLFTSRLVLTFTGLWVLATVTAAVLGIHTGLRVADYKETHPGFQNIITTRDHNDFNSIDISGGFKVMLTEAEEWGVELRGNARDIERIETIIRDDTLVVSKKIRPCFLFCFSDRAEVLVAMPDPEQIIVQNGSRLESSPITTDTLKIEVRNGSSVDMSSIAAEQIEVSASNASRASLHGTTSSLSLRAENASHINAGYLIANTVNVHAENASHVQVFASEHLQIDARNASQVQYFGTPTLTENVRNGSTIESSVFTTESDN